MLVFLMLIDCIFYFLIRFLVILLFVTLAFLSHTVYNCYVCTVYKTTNNNKNCEAASYMC